LRIRETVLEETPAARAIFASVTVSGGPDGFFMNADGIGTRTGFQSGNSL
jgi:hypothetical protein